MIIILSQDRKEIKKVNELSITRNGRKYEIGYDQNKILKNFLFVKSTVFTSLASYEEEINAEFVFRCIYAAIDKGCKTFKMPEDHPLKIGACIEQYLGKAKAIERKNDNVDIESTKGYVN